MSFPIQNEYKTSRLGFLFSEKEILWQKKKRDLATLENVILVLRQKT